MAARNFNGSQFHNGVARVLFQEHHRRWKPSTCSTKLKNQQQQEKIESILFFFAERKQKATVNFKDV